MKIINIKTSKRKEAIEITELVQKALNNNDCGIVYIYIPHTTAAVTVNEAFDPSVMFDMINMLNKIVPYSNKYTHLEGNSDAHIQSSLIGTSVGVIVEDGILQLGRWQGIFFMEFDGPRDRKIYIKFVEGRE